MAAIDVYIPLRYAHSPNEVVDPDDLEMTARLLAASVRSLGEVWQPDSFTPRR